jgi:acetyltransferase-like isoleucine patch superfamily enzyme
MLHKALTYFVNHSFFDFIRKLVFTICQWLTFSFYCKFRGLFHLKSYNVKLGQHVKISGFATNLLIGKDIQFYDACKIELSHTSNLQIGNRVLFSYGVVLCCRNKITIGSNVQIGEYTSIRDATHNYKGEHTIIMNNDDLVGEVEIGNNVWIGRNCLIGPGSVIEDGVVVGANSIVKGHLEKDCIYAGVPLRKIGLRN